MTTAEARTLAQSDPVPNLTQRWGELVRAVRDIVNGELSSALRELDKVAEQLDDKGVTVEADLGAIGNAAWAARRDLEKQRDTTPFELPR